MTSLGDIIYGDAVGLPLRRSGNTTTTKMYLSQTGDGTNSSAPQWSAIAVGDVSGAVSALTGEVSTTGSGSLNVTLSTTAVTGKLLTGLSVTSGAITSSDSILSAFGKVQGQINGLAGGSTYKGSWNASTNTPTIVSGTGTNGDYYIVGVAGSTTIDGISSWDVGDWIIFNGTVWQKIDNTDSVISVNGQVGSVVLTTANITENTNLYYTDARARAAISLTTTGASGAATYSSGVLNVPNYTIAGLGGISGSGTNNYLPKFTSATSIGNSIIAESAGLVTVYGDGQVYKGQAGSGLTSFYITNDDNTFGNRHETKISTQALGSGLGRTIIQAASYNTSTNRGELAILTESGANFVANIGTIITGSDNAFSLYNTIFTENIRLNTGGDSFLMGTNVGIGLLLPTEKLHVSGNAIVTGTLTANTIVKSGGTASQILAANGSVITAGSNITISGGTISTTGIVSTSTTITINGTTQDLSANRTYSVGTVTSVALSVPTGLSVTGSPITSSGTIAISLTAGYSIPTSLSQSNWDLAYNDKINSASVTGTTTKTLTLNQQDGGTITASWTDNNTDAVTSVFGRTGVVVAVSGDYNTSQVTENTNLYYTEARVNANSNVAANTAARHNAVTLGTANGLSLSTQVLSLALASTSSTGALSSTDWNTFNNKQSTITNPITGTGTTNYIPKFTAAGTIGNSVIIDDGSTVFINETLTPNAKLAVLQSTDSRYSGSFRTSATTGASYGLRIQAGTNSSDNTFDVFNQAGSTYFTIRGDGNIGIGTSIISSTGSSTISVRSGTAPSTNVVDSFQMYSNDITAGNAAPHFKTENGAVIKLYQETTSVGNSIFSAGGGSSVLDDSTFDGYTLRQIVKALRNQGILQ
jgi:hypothetical protein